MSRIHFLDPNPTGAQAVLLLHGLGADGSSWSLQFGALQEAGFRPIAPDTPGFGESTYDGRGWNFARMAAEMAALVREQCTSRVHLVGLSMGGVIAQQFALDFPDLTGKLVLTSTFSVLRPDSLSGWVYFLERAALVSTLGLPAQARIVARRVFPQPHYEPLREMLVSTISRANPRAYRRAMFHLGTFDSRKRLREISAATLVITGAEDSTVLPSRQKRLAEGIRGARHLVIPNAGHAVPVDQAEIFNRALVEFLRD